LLSGLKKYMTGQIHEERRYAGSDPLLRLKAIEAYSRFHAVDPSWLASLETLWGTLDTGTLPTAAVLDWLNILVRSPAFVNREKDMAKAEGLLSARLILSGHREVLTRTNGSYGLLSSFDADEANLVLSCSRRIN